MAEIQDLNESWEGHTHEEVEAFVRGELIKLEGGQYSQVTVSIVGSTIKSFIASSESVTFKFKVNNLVNGQYDPNFRVTIIIGSKTIDYAPQATSADDEIESPNIASYLALIGTNTITVKIIAYTESITSSARSIIYNRKTAVLTTANSISNTDPTSIIYNARFSGSKATAVVHFYGTTGSVSESSYKEETVDLTVAGQVTVPVPTLDAGAHIIKAYLLLEDGETASDVAITSIIITTGASEDACFITYEAISGATQNDYYNIKFACAKISASEEATYPVFLMEYDFTTATFIRKATRSIINSAVNTWQYLIPYTNNKIQIIVPLCDADGNVIYDAQGNYTIVASLIIEFTATATNISWKVKDGSLLYFSALNRTNSDTDKDTWESNGYSVEFEDMQWDNTGSGWQNQNCLHLIGSSKARIKNFYPFYDATEYKEGTRGGGILSTGLTFKTRFKVSNVSNPDEKVIQCFDENSGLGFYVTGDAIYLYLGAKLTSNPKESQAITGHNCRRFSSDTIIDLTVSLQPYYDSQKQETKHEVRYYINGEIAAFGVVDGTTISQLLANRSLVEFGGVGASLDLYDFRFYKSYLTAFEILQTRTMDLDSAVDIKSTFDKNNFYEIDGFGDPVITLNQAIAYGKYLASKGKTNFAISISTDLCNEYHADGTYNDKNFVGSTSYTNSTDKQSFYIIKFTTDSEGNGIIDPDQTIWIEAIAGGNLRMRRQGTSTKDATKGNVRIDVRGECHVHSWDSTSQTFNSDYTVVKKGATVFNIPDKEAISCSLLTMKKNPNESTQCRNLPTAKWYEDCSRYLATVNTGTQAEPVYSYEDVLTPPQRRELVTIIEQYPSLSRTEQIAKIKIRQCVDGIPSLSFEMTRTEDTTVAADPKSINSISAFGGQFDLITDKSNMGVFGFGGDGTTDDDFSVEWRENKSAVCNFHTTDISKAGTQLPDGSEGKKEMEYRYPNDDRPTVGGVSKGLGLTEPIQKLFDFIYNCSQHNIGYQSSQGTVSSDGGYITINNTRVPDNKTNRNYKFQQEFANYVVLNQFLFNGLAIDRGLMCDQDVKNQFFTYLTGDIDENENKLLRLLGYDFDSSWGCDNDNYFRFLYTQRYSDGLYDGKENGRGSDLWELVFDNFATEIETIAKYLYSAGLLGETGILKYMHDNQVDVYNAIIFNANSEYSYTSSTGDYEKAHGSAKEHNEWFVKGRMYFTSGLNFNDTNNGSDFAADMSSFNVAAYDNLDTVNKYNNQYKTDGSLKYWEVDVTGYERTNFYLGIDNRLHDGGFVNVETTYDESGMPTDVTRSTLSVKSDSVIQGGSDTRFRLYGGKHIMTIAGLEDWYISKINQWGELINVEELNLGSVKTITDASGNKGIYKNPAFNSLNIGDEIFGSCKKLNLGGCIAFTGVVDLSHFPILEEFEGRNMTGITGFTLPSGKSLKVVHYPENITAININNKPNITEITTQGTDNINTINVINSSQIGATAAIDILKTIIS